MTMKTTTNRPHAVEWTMIIEFASRHRWILGALVFAGSAACTGNNDVAGFGTAKEGEACDQVSDCVAGLDCVDDLCTPINASDGTLAGSECSSDGDCGAELVCGRQAPDGSLRQPGETGVCTTGPLLGDGESCGLTVECAFGLVCSGKGACVAEGSAGTLDQGAECSAFDDCRRPLVCGPDKTCVQLPAFLGLDCTRSDEEAGAYRVHFEVPEANTVEPLEFYRLPYPTDIRNPGTGLDLGGHPSPGTVLGIDVNALYFDSLEADSDGFAVNQPVFFRLSDKVDNSTLCLDPGGAYPEIGDGETAYCADNGAATVYLVNITPGSPEYNTRVPIEVQSSAEAGAFICQNSIGIHPLEGRPLRNGETYAAVVSSALLDVRGDAPLQDLDFQAMLGTQPPADASRPELSDAYVAMTPLRDWIGAESVDASTIAGAAVFTVEAGTEVGAEIREAVRGVTPAFANNAVNCNLGATSPCPGASGDDRGCPTVPSTSFVEVQGTYEGPVIQAGTRPYKRVGDGGAMEFDGQGNVVLQSPSETMCYSLAIDGPTLPGAGNRTVPVVIYGHGTEGNHRSAMDDGTAELLTGLGFAVIGFDNVMHGPRQGSDDPSVWEDPGQLFFNPLNPRASRDNILQGSADLFHLVHMLESASVTVGGHTINFDTEHIYYYGHSQGTVISPAFLAHETGLAAVFQSGAGAELALSILNKSEPQAIDQAVGASFGERNLSRIHPMMGLLAQLFGPADAIGYAPMIIMNPPLGRTPAPYLQAQGIGDNYTPDPAQKALIRAMGIPYVGQVTNPAVGINTVAGPVTAAPVAGAVQFAPDGDYDGHFVAFRRADLRAVIADFFQRALADSPRIQN